MFLFKKTKIKVFLLIYWMIHASNAIVTSRDPGFYPKDVMAQAQYMARLKPYPWDEIIIASGVMGVATVILYFIIVKYKRASSLILYSFVIFFLNNVLFPTDLGGVHIAVSIYIICTFLLSFMYAAFTVVAKKLMGMRRSE